MSHTLPRERKRKSWRERWGVGGGTTSPVNRPRGRLCTLAGLLMKHPLSLWAPSHFQQCSLHVIFLNNNTPSHRSLPIVKAEQHREAIAYLHNNELFNFLPESRSFEMNIVLSGNSLYVNCAYRFPLKHTPARPKVWIHILATVCSSVQGPICLCPKQWAVNLWNITLLCTSVNTALLESNQQRKVSSPPLRVLSDSLLLVCWQFGERVEGQPESPLSLCVHYHSHIKELVI